MSDVPRYGPYRLPLLESWQGGPAHLTVETDVVFDGETRQEAPAVIFRVETPTDFSAGDLEIGSGHFSFPKGQGGLVFYFAASLEQARALYDALTLMLDADL